MTDIHPTAIIEKGAEIADNVTIGAYCRIGAHVRIDKGTTVASHTVIEGHTHIGKNNRIFSFATLGSIPQDLKYHGEESQLIIGDDNTIREYTLLNPGTEGGGMVTRVGNGNLLMGYVHLGHDVQVGNRCILANAATIAGHVIIDDFAIIGGMTPVHQFVHIGEHAMIGGASAVAQDIPPYCLAEGNRATLRGVNKTGLRRRAFSRERITRIDRAFKRLFRSGRSPVEIAKELKNEESDEAVLKMCNFVLESTRGVPFREKK